MRAVSGTPLYPRLSELPPFLAERGFSHIPGLSGIHEPSSAGSEAVTLAFLIAWLESTVRYLGIEVDDALEISESIEV